MLPRCNLSHTESQNETVQMLLFFVCGAIIPLSSRMPSQRFSRAQLLIDSIYKTKWEHSTQKCSKLKVARCFVRVPHVDLFFSHHEQLNHSQREIGLNKDEGKHDFSFDLGKVECTNAIGIEQNKILECDDSTNLSYFGLHERSDERIRASKLGQLQNPKRRAFLLHFWIANSSSHKRNSIQLKKRKTHYDPS